MSEDQLARKIPPPFAPAEADAEYDCIYAEVMRTVQGRRFLDEHARRNATGGSGNRGGTAGHISGYESLDLFLFDVADMAQAIARTKAEIAAIKPPADRHGQIDDATGELDSIVRTTERATSRILAAAEQMQEIAWTLREKGMEERFCDQLDAQATEIYTACSFQDLTGQRTGKVIQVLRYLEHRVNTMIEIWGKDVVPAAARVPDSAGATRTSGPSSDGLDQADVDLMMQQMAPPEDGPQEQQARAEESTRQRQDATIEDIGRVMMALGPLMATYDDDPPTMEVAAEPVRADFLQERRPQLSTVDGVLKEASDVIRSAESTAMPPVAFEPPPEPAAAVETSGNAAPVMPSDAEPSTMLQPAGEPSALILAMMEERRESQNDPAQKEPVPELGISSRTTAARLAGQTTAPKTAAEPAWSALERLALTFLPDDAREQPPPTELLTPQPIAAFAMPRPEPSPEKPEETMMEIPPTELDRLSAPIAEPTATPVAGQQANVAEINASLFGEAAASVTPTQQPQNALTAQEKEQASGGGALETEGDDFLFAPDESVQESGPADFLLEPMPMPATPAQPLPAMHLGNGRSPEPSPLHVISAPPAPTAQALSKPMPRINDPLAPLRALSDEEKIALFS
jgi:hypothetical protein